MSVQLIVYIITILALLISLFFLLITKPRTQAVTYFTIAIASVTCWVVLNMIADTTPSTSLSLFTSRIAIIGPLIALPSIFLFTKAFPYNENTSSTVANLIPFIPLVIILPFINTSYNVVSVNKTDSGWEFIPGILYPILGGLVAIYLFGIIRELIIKYRNGDPLERRQLNYFFSSFFITVILALLFTLVLPILGYPQFAYIGPSSALLFIFSTLYIITTTKFLDVQILLTNITKTSILSPYLFILYYSSHFLITKVSSSTKLQDSWLTGCILAFIAAGITININNRINNYSFLRNKNIDLLKEDISQISSTTLVLDTLISNIASSFQKNFDLTFAYMKVTNDQTNHMSSYMTKCDLVTKTDVDNVIEQIDVLKQGRSFIYDEYKINFLKSGKSLSSPQGKNLQLIKDVGIAFTSFTKTTKRNIIILVLGTKKSGLTLSVTEIEAVQDTIPILKTAIDRSTLYEETRRFADTLQQKVDTATKELTVRNKELQDLYDNLEEIYQKEKDLMDIAGHEFRTPASILKNNLYLLKKRLKEVCPANADEKLHVYLDRLIEGTDRQIKLVNTFLESARIDNQRFEIQVEVENVQEMIKTAVDDIKQFAKQKGLQVIYHNSQKKIFAEIDHVRLREVIDNLLNNAVKYTETGYIEVTLTDKKESVLFSVKDTGIGIKKEDHVQLFKKFSRIEKYIGGEDGTIVRPGGTGLGLYVSRTIVEAHGGKIWLESELGKGSTFFFEIPKKQPSYIKRVDGSKGKLESKKSGI